jgi:superoxide dismutase, Fe-Mn family
VAIAAARRLPVQGIAVWRQLIEEVELKSDDPVALPPLPWRPGALDPTISARTIEHHYGQHHRTYVEKTLELTRGTEMESLPLEDVVRRAHEQGNKQLFNNAAQAWNHTLYWNSLRPGGGGKPGGAIATAVERDFGSTDGLRKKWLELAKKQFGSGWVWLVIRSGGRLELEATGNADTPLVRGDIVLLTVDVWEHAYYLDWQHKRPEYVSAVLEKLIDWKGAAERYAAVERAVA